MKAISKGSLASCLVHLDAGILTCLALQNLQIPEHANNRTLPSWFLCSFICVYIYSDRLTSVALMPFWSLPHLLKNSIANHSSFAPGVTPKTTQQRCMQSLPAQCQGRYTLLRLNTVKIRGLDTDKRPLENNTRFFVST